MRLKYQTGIAGLVQLSVMTVLNAINLFYSDVQQCTNTSGNCISNLILQFLFFIVITGWFAFLWLLGAAAQERRSRKLALLLIFLELGVAAIALSDAKRHTFLLGLITSLTDATLALWMVLLAARLLRAGGRRVVASSQRARQRRYQDHPTEL